MTIVSPMRDPSLDDARARQRRALRTFDDTLLKGWLPPPHHATGPPKNERPFAEIALRQAADELGAPLGVYFAALADLSYADTATAIIRARKPKTSFETYLAALAQKRLQALDQLERLRVDDNIVRWVNLVVWADQLADDGYRDPRLT